MQLLANEIAKRRLVWWALSELFLDTEHSQEWLHKLAEIIMAAGFSLSETHDIFLAEVAPVFYLNFLSVAGEWSGWSEDYVEDSVMLYLQSSVATRFVNLRMCKVIQPKRMWKAFSPVLEETFRSASAEPVQVALSQ
jgi:hypothetical protein